MLVADVGNTRIKWGDDRDRAVALPDDPDAWRRQIADWGIDSQARWTIAGVHPQRRDRFAHWLGQIGHRVEVIDHYSKIPLTVSVDHPETVGHDRLLNVLAAKALVPAGRAAVAVDAGSAVTVDLLDESGAFAGGAIFPGLRLMAEALHDRTALLPLVKAADHAAIVPAKSTAPAIAAGIHWAVVGGVSALLQQLALTVAADEPLAVFLTGGDATAIAADLPADQRFRYELRPRLTLDGIRLASQSR